MSQFQEIPFTVPDSLVNHVVGINTTRFIIRRKFVDFKSGKRLAYTVHPQEPEHHAPIVLRLVSDKYWKKNYIYSRFHEKLYNNKNIDAILLLDWLFGKVGALTQYL